MLQLTFELLGLIAQEYPHSLLNDYDTQIRDLFFHTLETTLLNQLEVRCMQRLVCKVKNFFKFSFSIRSCHYVVR